MHRPALLNSLHEYSVKHKSLWTIATMLLFVYLFDGIIGYTVPLLLTENGLTKTQMGLIFSFSSVAGGIFDFALSKFIQRVNFRRIFFFMFLACAAYPAVLLGSNTLVMYLLAMAVWGIYYDLLAFGSYDFVGRHTPKTEHSSSFGVMEIFKSLGLLLAPVLAGLLIVDRVTSTPYILAWIFLAIGVIFYLVLLRNVKKGKYELISEKPKSRGVLKELKIWKNLGKLILPVVVFTIFLNVFDAFFWTIGPLVSENLPAIQPFGGLFLTAYFLPSAIMGLFVGPITLKYGKKRTAFMAMILGGLILSTFAFVSNPFLLILIVLLSSGLSAIAWPAIRGAYADYISEAPEVESDIEGVADLSNNIGYVIGPALAGFLSDSVGDSWVFSILGIAGVVLSLILLKVTPRHIHIPEKV